MKDELIDGKDETTYKVLVFDTMDRLEKIATDYVVKQAKRNDKKNYKTIGDIPWGGGYNMLSDAVSDLISELDMAGFTLWFITHDKDKKFETKDGLSYDKTILSVGGRVGDIIKNDSDFIVFIELAKEPDDEGNIVDKRYIHFRGDGALEAGGRFKNLPDKIEYDVDDFVETLKGAILQDGFNGDEKAMKKALETQEKEFEEKMASTKEKEEQESNLADLQEEFVSLIKSLEKTEKAEVSKEMKGIFGTIKYKEIEDFETFKKFIDNTKEKYGV